MTPRTGKRSSRACLRCRQRKTRCDLDRIGEPRKAPCLSCYDAGTECILIKSRRGGNFRQHRPESETLRGSRASLLTHIEDSSEVGVESFRNMSDLARCSSDDEDSVARQDSGDVLAMELRNPSDALQILALSGQAQSTNQPRDQSSNIASPSDRMYPAPQDTDPAASSQPEIPKPYKPPSTTIFDDYELVQRGLLRPSLVSELLYKYRRYYHSYCPIVPSQLLVSSNMAIIQRSDYFLLTAILTIASRDDPRNSLTHRYCWDHTQRLLVDVLLAHPWTQTPATVQGLLLLAEWLPHIQVHETSSESPKSLFSEDRTAWSLVGLAVHHGYLQRLDQAAFRNFNSNESKQRTEQDRLVWAYIFIADRQISVRLGQSFWSRGPSLAAKFTAEDFPSLQPRPENDNEDHASLLQASMELIQILHNVHAILYSSRDRTLAMIHEGHYSRYLDDFRNSATIWYSTWGDLAVSTKVKSTLLIMYEYICLYANAFSFQAVLTRASEPRMPLNKRQQSKRPFADLLSKGIMLSPDGRYIFDAISAAMNLLTLMNGLDPQHVLCYLPSRYYLYGVYAAVLLHKADCAGAFQSEGQQREVTSLARKFVAVLEKAPSTESHICHNYSQMLKQLWNRRQKEETGNSRCRNETIRAGYLDGRSTQPPPPVTRTYDRPRSVRNSDNPGSAQRVDSLPIVDDVPSFPSIEGYFLGSFMPGVADFSMFNFDGDLGQQYPLGGGLGGFQDWDLCQPDMDSRGPP
ncbi:hypothetical protein BDV38DRAFT_292222 [Aspergillus pseudotamarii]|uniref:Zn(2)-C6 fungal-type domain-containing protein n=1 Tax=Aspergillus pseudotamarii TaxID=132259 RepID=A0A5N6SZV6_ASPPS|nr:uncharacterized protein BDV38DRAFT_292222 [Aspergillus pseudotamarii]KAE8138664.1 hypothetical protein BDV38DRAFT_292222 [Aspergillus pseudotamarii]